MYLFGETLKDIAATAKETATAIYEAKLANKNKVMGDFNLQKAMTGAKVMTQSRLYTGQYLLTLQGCPHVFIHVFKMNGPDGEKLIQVNNIGQCFHYPADKVFGIFAHPDNLIMAPEVKTVWVNFYLDANGGIQCTSPQTSYEDACAISNREDSGNWRFIKTEQIVLEY